MEQVDLNQYGFIKSVNLCITLLQEFGNKITPEQLDEFLGNHTKIYMSSDEFLSLVVNSVIKGGDDFVEKMNALFEVKDQILETINAQNIINIIEGKTQMVCEELLMEDSYIVKLADFCLAQSRFRDFLYAYTKDQVADAISKMDLSKVIVDIVKTNADEYAKLLLFSTKQSQLKAEASLFCIQSIEKLVSAMYKGVIYDPDYLHPQGTPK